MKLGDLVRVDVPGEGLFEGAISDIFPANRRRYGKDCQVCVPREDGKFRFFYRDFSQLASPQETAMPDVLDSPPTPAAFQLGDIVSTRLSAHAGDTAVVMVVAVHPDAAFDVRDPNAPGGAVLRRSAADLERAQWTPPGGLWIGDLVVIDGEPESGEWTVTELSEDVARLGRIGHGGVDPHANVSTGRVRVVRRLPAPEGTDYGFKAKPAKPEPTPKFEVGARVRYAVNVTKPDATVEGHVVSYMRDGRAFNYTVRDDSGTTRKRRENQLEAAPAREAADLPEEAPAAEVKPTSPALEHLRAATLSDDGRALTLPAQLDRTDYAAVTKVLEALGGKWDRKSKTHVFKDDVRPALAAALAGEPLPARNPLAFYETPLALATRLMAVLLEAGVEDGARVLEPSAGNGGIADVLAACGYRVSCCEIDLDRRNFLRSKQLTVVADDFLTYTPGPSYDAVVMNPPFTAPGDKLAYIAHIEHAWDCLRPGGVLVAVAPTGFTFRADKRSAAFKAFVDEHGTTEVNDAGIFRASGADVSTVTVVLKKPAAEEPGLTVPASAMDLALEEPELVVPAFHLGQTVVASINFREYRGHVDQILGGRFRVITEVADLPPFWLYEHELRAAEIRAEPPGVPAVFKIGDAVRVATKERPWTQATPTRVTAARWDEDRFAWFYTIDGEEVEFADVELVREDVVQSLAGAPAETPEEAPSAAGEAPEPTPDAPNVDAAPDVPAVETGIRFIPWNKLVPSDLNPRKHFDQASLVELAISIKRKGVKQNLQARPHPTRPGLFEIAAGERRWRAVGLLVKSLEVGEGAERDTLFVEADYPMPVLVEDMTDLELLENATTENVQRRRMSPLEEADAFAALARLGANVDELAARFGYAKRTVARRIEIGANLSPAMRERYEEGKLTLAQAEILAQASHETQEALWDSQLRYSASTTTAAQLRSILTGRLFLTKHRQFPPSWYTGVVNPGDLFGDIEEHFADPAQALDCQLKHARHLAQKDIEQGARFADVVLNESEPKWDYDASPDATGVYYWIESRSGRMARVQGVQRRDTGYTKYTKGVERFDAPVPTHETPGGASPELHGTAAGGARSLETHGPVPSRVVAPQYPVRLVANRRRERAERRIAADDHAAKAMALAAYLEDCDFDEANPPDDLYEAVQQAKALSGGILISGQEGEKDWASRRAEFVLNDDLLKDTPRHSSVVLGALYALPDDVLTVLWRYAVSFEIEGRGFGTSESNDLASAVGDPLPPFIDEAFVQACNRPALEQLLQDAGHDPKLLERKKDDELRAHVLKLAPELLASGFVPRVFREDLS